MIQTKKELVGQVKHVKLVGACLVVACALVAVAASVAQAAGPEWGRCVEAAKGTKGLYEDSNCTKEKVKEKKGVKSPDGKYEWKSGAPAAPGCEAKKHGNYLTSACNTEKEKKGVVEEHKGKFEKFGPKFTGEGGKGVLSATTYQCLVEPEQERERAPRADCNASEYNYHLLVKNINVECTSEHASGEAVGTHEVANVSVRFNGCLIFGGDPCKSLGASPEEIRVNPLKGQLGYIEKSGPKVGVLLEPVASKGTFVELECENVEERVVVGVGNATEGAFYLPEATGGNDGVISPITPVNTMTPKFTQEYTANAARENVPSHFEGGPTELLEMWTQSTEYPVGTFGGSTWSPAGQEITNVNTVEGEAEIKA